MHVRVVGIRAHLYSEIRLLLSCLLYEKSHALCTLIGDFNSTLRGPLSALCNTQFMTNSSQKTSRIYIDLILLNHRKKEFLFLKKQKCKYLSAFWSIDASRKMLLINTTSSYSGQDILQVILQEFTIFYYISKKRIRK